MKRLCIILLASLLCTGVLSACSTNTPPVVPQPTIVRVPTRTGLTSPLAAPTTAAGASAVSPLAAPASTSAPLAVSGTGVAGRLLRLTTGAPIKGLLVYAAKIDSAGGIPVASVDPATDPKTTTNAAGDYAFTSLTPGEYILMAQSPLKLVVLATDDQKPIRFTVTSGQITQLGTKSVDYTFPDD